MGKRKRHHDSSSSESEDDVRYYVSRLKAILDHNLPHGQVPQSGAPLITPGPSGARESTGGIQHTPSTRLHRSTSPPHEADNNPEATGLQTEEEPPEQAHLNRDMLTLLGHQEVKKPETAPLHQDVADIWAQILTSGLEENTRAALVEKYPTPSNCVLMAAPKVNGEVAAAVSEATLTRDKRLAATQGRLGAVLSALGRSISLLVSSEAPTVDDKQLIIEQMGDAARLVADTHYEQSITRQNILKPNLNKELADTLCSGRLDGWLFGENLKDRIKAAKSLEKTSVDLKPKSQSKIQGLRKDSGHLNSRGPPRYNKSYNRYQPARRGGQNRPNQERHYPRRTYTDQRRPGQKTKPQQATPPTK